MQHFELFDAVRIVRLPQGRNEIPAYYSQTGTAHIKLGDIGVVIGDWPKNKYRVEAVNAWYTDPLVISFGMRSHLNWLQREKQRPAGPRWLEVAPDVIHKANVSGGAPVALDASSPDFDTPLIGQHGSYTLLSYLRWAFEWGGFPGFDFIPDAPHDMLRELTQGLTKL